MPAPTNAPHALAYDDEGAGDPGGVPARADVHRRSWRPIIERLEGSLRSIAVDLPAQAAATAPR